MDKEFCRKVSGWIDAHEAEIFADVKRLLSIPSVAELDSSVKPYGQSCRDVMEEYIRIAGEHGYRCCSYGDRVVRADTPEGEGRPDIGIWNHLDVVPAGHDWLYPSYDLTIKDGYLIGRGIKDNKGPAVAAIYSLQCLRELGVEMKHRISLYAGLEEEKEMSDIHWLKDHQVELPAMNVVLDSRYPVCFGEKGILSITIAGCGKLSADILELSGGESANSVAGRARMGLKMDAAPELPQGLPDWISISWAEGRLSIETKGLSKHAAHPEGSENAIHRLFAAVCGADEACRAVHELAAGVLDRETMEMFGRYELLSRGIYGEGLEIAVEDEISGKLTAVASLVSLKDQVCSMTWNIRYPISLKEDSGLTAKIKATAEKYAMAVTEASGKAPGYLPKEHPLIENLMGTFNEFLGRSEEPFTMAGGTYARLLPGGFVYGFRIVPEPELPQELIPAGHGGSHSANEAVSVELYKQQLALLIVSLAESQKVKLS